MNALDQIRQAHEKLKGTALGIGTGTLMAMLENQGVRDALKKEDDAKLSSFLRELVQSVNHLATKPSRLTVAQVDEFLAGLGQGTRPAQPTAAQVQSFSTPPSATQYSYQIGPDGEPIRDSSGRPIVQITRLGQMNLLAQALATPEVGAAVGGLVMGSAPTATQLEAIRSYFCNLMTAAVLPSVGGSTPWLAHNSQSLADPALDEPWALTYNAASLTGDPSITSATPGGIALGAQATAVKFAFIVNQEQQTVRSFRLKITPSTTAGVLFTAYLPKPLRGRGAPKVHLQVENLGVVAVGSPFVSLLGGGENPYFQVSSGTNPAAASPFNLSCWLTL